MAELRARILSNVNLPAVPGFSIRYFGHYLSPAATGGELPSTGLIAHASRSWRPEMERRKLADILPLIPQGEQPDILVVSSPEYLPIPTDIADFPGLKILLITDWNVCLRFLPDLCPLFDFCFTDWPGYRLLKKAGVANIHHQPLFGHDPDHFRFLNLPRNLDVSFCGNFNSGLHGERNRLLARLAKWGAPGQGRTVHLRQAFDSEYVEVLNRSKLVFNYSIRGEANMRLFESMATGAVALVEESNQEVGILFQENRHFFRYAPGALEERLNSLLADPDRLSSVAAAGREAVTQHSKSRQIQTLLETACRAGRSIPPGSAAQSQLKGIKALHKLRVLGAGYTLAETLEEIQMHSGHFPGLAEETLPATLLTLLAQEPRESLQAVERILQKFLADPLFSETLRAFFSLKLAVHHGQWTDVLAHATNCLELLNSLLLESEAESTRSLYGNFYPPIGLGKAFNSDLNLAYQQDLIVGKPQRYRELLSAHCCLDLAKAYHELGQPSASVTELQRMPVNRFTSLDIYQALLTDLLQVGDREGAFKLAAEWFAKYPLDTGIWNFIYNAYAQLGDKSTTLRFLEELEILAAAFLSTDQMARVQDLVLREKAGT